jgi:hypothetical protein
MVESYLARRTLEPNVDREALVQLGALYLREADAAASAASAGTSPPLAHGG